MLTLAKNIFNSPYTLWIILALPAPALLADFSAKNRYYAEIMYESGLLSVQLMVLALALTPLMKLIGHWSLPRKILHWLIKRRRAIGVASFGYAALHTVFYIREIGSIELIWLELSEISLAVGWLAFIILIALAITSNNFSVKHLGTRWKILQRTAYAAAAFTALHWLLIEQFQKELLLWFVPIAVIQALRITKKAYQLSSSKGN